MKERPIIFSTDMVKAILAGNKTMTRRVIKKPMALPPDNQIIPELLRTAKDIMATWCPYGQVGDRLWVRETWLDYAGMPVYRADKSIPDVYHWRPSIFMPRWASRITLEITELRAERAQEITPEDCLREGVLTRNQSAYESFSTDYRSPTELLKNFQILWDSFNARRGHGWDKNDWVWPISFRRLE